MELQRNSFKRTSIASMKSNRSKSSDISIENVLEQFKQKKPSHQDFIYYYVDDYCNYKRKSRGSDLLAKLEDQQQFRFSNRNSNSNANNNQSNQQFNQINFQIPLVQNRLDSLQYSNLQYGHACSCYINCQGPRCPCSQILEVCIEGRCCSVCIQYKNYYLNGMRELQQNQKMFNSKNQIYQCACKKTKCLKMYCQCFSKNGFCTASCGCQDCFNKQNSQLRQKARMQMSHLQQRGCKCKKTKCEKKYCNCYGNGEKCTKYCECQNCNNMNEQLQKLRYKKQIVVKMEEQQVQIKYQPCKQIPNQIEFEMPDFSKLNI